MRRRNNPRFEILTGWKEIANYLEMGVRTVQRYERELGLPIRRPGESQTPVIAIKTELDAWIGALPVQLGVRALRLRAQTNSIGAQFLLVDSAVGLTFSGIALKTSSCEERTRRTQAARKAYDTIMRLKKNLDLHKAERDKLDANLQRLKHELQTLGESF